MEKLTSQEEEVMLIIWRQQAGTVKDFLNEMPEPQPPYTTLASVVKNLERKQYVIGQKLGNTYLYRPAIAEDEYKKNFLSRVVRDYFSNSYKDMISFFARDQKISAQELEEIRKLIDKDK